jgi:hypothetical protein
MGRNPVKGPKVGHFGKTLDKMHARFAKSDAFLFDHLKILRLNIGTIR